ncbi:hypothetical protein [Enterobacter bugandensis]|uniref:hypothetical protein n=1 Tax=Enterobacter bugandensis TaxID=881260 RepID=UPI0023620BDD|nr:hypothetical protein [Enterobacter bugandensis]
MTIIADNIISNILSPEQVNQDIQASSNSIMGAIKVFNTIATPKSWEVEMIAKPAIDIREGDCRHYPSSHDKYDLAELNNPPVKTGPVCTEKASKKYNIPHLALLDKKNFLSQIDLFKTESSSGGVPGYIDAFFKSEPGGRTEGYALHPEQFCGTKFDPELGGFLISPNPSNIPEKGQSYTNDAFSLLEKTKKNGKGFGLVCYWVPPMTYEKYPMFKEIFPEVKVPKEAPEVEPCTIQQSGREKRLPGVESNNEYQQRTGLTFLSIPLDLGEKHVPLLQELKKTIVSHLAKVYGCDVSKEKVEIYSHSPIYAMESCGLHIHVRVNEGRHPLETDLRNLKIDDFISQLQQHGKITHAPWTKSEKFISYNVAAKSERAVKNGISFTKVPNPWVTPTLKTHAEIIKPLNVQKTDTKLVAPQQIQLSARSAKKYDSSTIGLVSREAMEQRIERYGNNTILPNFIYQFFTDNKNSKYQALLNNQEQFPATSFNSDIGGMFLMPNTKYVAEKKDFYANPGAIIEQSRFNGGVSLVGYWVPPAVFEGSDAFERLFPGQDTILRPEERETVTKYNDRTGKNFIVNPIDLKKSHLGMLKEFKSMTMSHLAKVYNFDARKDKVDLYLHSPIYGNKTAGLHIHVRVNQKLSPGELDVNRLSLDRVIEIITNAENDDSIKAEILADVTATNSGNIYSFSAAWGPKQFEGLGVRYIPNPWKRPG